MRKLLITTVLVLTTSHFLFGQMKMDTKPMIYLLAFTADTTWMYVVSNQSYLYNYRTKCWRKVDGSGLLSINGKFVDRNIIYSYDNECNEVSKTECSGGENFKGDEIKKVTADGKYYIRRYDKGANIYDMNTGKLHKSVKYPAKKCPYIYMNDKVGFYRNEEKTSLVCFDLGTGKTKYEINAKPEHTSYTANYAFSSDHKKIVIANNKTFEVFDFNSGKLIATIDGSRVIEPNEYGIDRVALSVDNRLLACMYKKKIHVFDFESGVFLATINTENNYPAACFATDKESVIVGDGHLLKWYLVFESHTQLLKLIE